MSPICHAELKLGGGMIMLGSENDVILGTCQSLVLDRHRKKGFAEYIKTIQHESVTQLLLGRDLQGSAEACRIGWEISSIASFDSGKPLNIITGTSNNASGYTTNLDPHRTRSAVAAEWFNPAAFVPNKPGARIGPYGADGNTPRDYLRSPGYRDVDLGVFRSFSLESMKLQLRAEVTNAFNMVSLAPPNANLSSAQCGKITSAVPNSFRQIQLGGRLTL